MADEIWYVSFHISAIRILDLSIISHQHQINQSSCVHKCTAIYQQYAHFCCNLIKVSLLPIPIMSSADTKQQQKDALVVVDKLKATKEQWDAEKGCIS